MAIGTPPRTDAAAPELQIALRQPPCGSDGLVRRRRIAGYFRPSRPRPIASSSMPRSVPDGPSDAEALEDRHLAAVDDAGPAQLLARGADRVGDRGAAAG